MTSEELILRLEEVVRYSYSRSAGPGGQNVNKLNTKVTARLNPDELTELSETDLIRLRRKLINRINEAGELVIQVQEERSQSRNRQTALFRMAALILQALKRPKRRKPTKPSAQVKERRLEQKKRRGEVKSKRRKNFPID